MTNLCDASFNTCISDPYKEIVQRVCFLSGGREAKYDEFLTDIMACGPDDCRYGLFDFEYDHQCEGTTEKTKKEKLLLMSWCPDTAKIKKKMLYSSSFDALKKCLVGVQKYIQVGR